MFPYDYRVWKLKNHGCGALADHLKIHSEVFGRGPRLLIFPALNPMISGELNDLLCY
jgi:hypothetical protein